MIANDRGDWIQTYSGRRFWPMDPKPEDVHLEDIAHALAMKCRFSGHCLRFYSVTQHCYEGIRYADRPSMMREFLMHDAAEAYLVDMPRPIKPSFPTFKLIEDKIHEAIRERFRITSLYPKEVKEIDNRMLMTERRDLMAQTSHEWSLSVEPYPDILEFHSWEKAKTMFLFACGILGIK